jgi:hypothetical protein
MIVIAHNRYRSAYPSGENIVQEREQRLLLDAGEVVEPWLLSSDDLLGSSRLEQLRTAWRLGGDDARRRAFADHLRRARDRGARVVHLHNPWPLFTYDIALAARDAGLPIVQTLHNYRLIGTNDRLVSDGRLRAPRGAIERLHLSRMANNHPRIANLFYNRALAAWWSAGVPQTAIDAYLCLTGYQERLIHDAGVPRGRTHVLPNFLDHH